MMSHSRRDSSGDGDIVEWCPDNSREINGMDMVTSYFQSQTELAAHLCIHSLGSKLKRESECGYSIGGTYNKETEEFWFFGSTSLCHGGNYLLNLFVVTRNDVRFSLFLPSVENSLTDHIQENTAEKYCEITGPTKEYIYTTSKKDEVVFVRTFCFSKDDLQKLGHHPLLIPCSIQIHTGYRIHPDIANKIKLQYTVELNEALYKNRSNGDFIIKSATHTEYPVHLFVAAAHSPVLRDTIKQNKKNYCLNMSDEEVEMLVAFLYNGSVENLTVEKAPQILEMADMLGLPGMSKLGEVVMSANLNKDNAVEIAKLAKKYNLQELSQNVFHFIKQNPDLLLSSSIQTLDDIDLMRSMLQHVGNPCECKCGPKKTAVYLF